MLVMRDDKMLVMENLIEGIFSHAKAFWHSLDLGFEGRSRSE